MQKTLPNEPLRALVLTPADMRQRTDMSAAKQSYNRYALMTSVPDPDMRVIENAQVPRASGFDLYETPTGRPCGMALMQVDKVLLRILVPLDVEHARDWLSEALAKGSYLVLLDMEEAGQLTMVEVRLPGNPDALKATRKAAAAPPMPPGTQSEFSALVADLRLLAGGLLLTPPQSLLRDCEVERSWLALAGRFSSSTSGAAVEELY